MRIAVLLCFPAWCHGEHGLPRPSLVQVSSRGTAHAKVKADSMSSTLAGFQKFTDALVDQYLKEGLPDDTGIEAHGTRAGNMTSETRTAIESVLGYIDSFFENAVVQHNIDKAIVQACTDKICSEACSLNATKVGTEADRVATQKVNIQTCLDTFISQSQVNNQACVMWDVFRLDPANELPVCVYKANDDNFCEQENPEIEFEKGDLCDNKIKADEVADEQPLESMEDCLEDIYAWLAITKPKSDACDRTREEEDTPCQPVVEEYHSDHCEYAMVLKEECNNFDTCVNNCNDGCDQNLCDQIDIKKGARMADNETGERIICLLKVLLNETVIDKAVELSNCNDAALATRGYSRDATYADLASYFELSCQPSNDDPSYPPGVSCADRNQAVSLSTAYMEKLMEDMPTLKTTDNSNPTISDKSQAMWDSCASVHVCGSSPANSSGWLNGDFCMHLR